MKYTLFAVGLFVHAVTASASIVTIVGTTATGGDNILTSPAGITWTQTGSYSGVTITALLGGVNGGATGTAYFTNQTGPGTTPANDVALPFSIPAVYQGFTTVTLFSGLTLGPGTYDLILTGTPGKEIGLAGSIFGYTGDTGVTGITSLNVSGTPATFAPASSFVSGRGTYDFSVTGTPVAVSSTPEPVSWLTLMSGLVVLAVFRIRRMNKQAAIMQT